MSFIIKRVENEKIVRTGLSGIVHKFPNVLLGRGCKGMVSVQIKFKSQSSLFYHFKLIFVISKKKTWHCFKFSNLQDFSINSSLVVRRQEEFVKERKKENEKLKR